jgi:ubiquinone biosynthesis protein
MKISAKHLPRYRQIARLLWKYGRSDLVNQMNLDDPFESAAPPPTRDGDPTPDELAADLEAMGPTFVKLGQVLSSRPDILPPRYLEALSRLQDKVQPFSYEEVEKIVEGELGVRISKAFSRFDTTPLAAASLGQVHAAALRDGHEVVVKVQRPGISENIGDDFEVLAQIAEFLETHTETGRRHRLLDTLEQFRVTIGHELNYEREARNLEAMGENLAEFEDIVVPQPVSDYCTRRVLTMDYVSGSKITKVSPIARLDMDGAQLAEQLFRAYLKQVLVDGLFHADPHPGNVFLTDDYRIALLDLGMVGHTTPGMQHALLKILIAVSEGRSEEACKVIEDISETESDFDRQTFHKRIAQVIADQRNMELQKINVGTTLLQVTRIGAQLGLYVPSELTVLGKTLLQLDQVGKVLDPEFDPNAAVRRNAAAIMSQRVNRDATQGSILSSLLEMKEFVGGLPSRLNKVLDAVGNREMEVKVRTPDVDVFLTGMEKVANRITTGIVLAALIIGASLLMRVETDFRVFGYPGFAMLLFVAAATMGFWLVITIILHDRRAGKRGVGP